MKLLINGYTVTECFKVTKIEDIFSLDRAIGHIKKNKFKYMKLVCLIALSVNLAGFAPSTAAIDKAGNTILALMRKVGYWVGIILCTKDVIKHSMRGHLESIGTVVALYGISFGVLYFLPWFFNIIMEIFG